MRSAFCRQDEVCEAESLGHGLMHSVPLPKMIVFRATANKSSSKIADDRRVHHLRREVKRDSEKVGTIKIRSQISTPN